MDGDLDLSMLKTMGWLEGVRDDPDATSRPKTPTQSAIEMAGDRIFAAPEWVLEHHDDEWTATVGSKAALIEECCMDGAKILSTMNHGSYQMPFGTRVVCIKTQHLCNVHIALQNGIWVAEAAVGERINQVFKDHDPSAGEKVLFIFSINKQKSFCALAEMTSMWKKGDPKLPGWEEARDSYKTVGSIEITFTHVKNVANDHFDHIRHENNQQPISNMWNGMHFPPDKGRQVVQVFHEQPHFTNILCRDKRKRYNPADAVTNTQDLDPRMNRHRSGPPRGTGTPHSSNNWRRGGTGFGNATTPTRSAFPKLSEGRPQNKFKTPTPPQPSGIKRESVPTPLHLRNSAHVTQAKASPRPGQIIKCIVDENGNYIPIGPVEESPEVPHTTLRAEKPQTLAESVRSFAGQWPACSANTSNGSDQSRGIQTDGISSINLPDAAIQRKFPTPRPAACPNSLPSPGHALPDSVVQQDFHGQNANAQASTSASTDWMRRAAIQAGCFIPNSTQFDLHMHQAPASELSARRLDPAYLLHDAQLAQALDTKDSSDFFEKYVNQQAAAQAPQDQLASEHFFRDKINLAALNPRDIAFRAHQKNENFLYYQSIRHQASVQTENASPSTGSSDFKDWASTSEIERLRITPMSPLGRDGDPFMSDSVSKKQSPTAKAFAASVDREIRTMRQGQRATPTPHKAHKRSAFSIAGDDHRTGLGVHCSPARGADKDGGVPIPCESACSNVLNTAMRGDAPAPYVLPGLGHAPRNLLPALTAAGQNASNAPPRGPNAATSLSSPEASTSAHEQQPRAMIHTDSVQAVPNAQDRDESNEEANSDLIGFTP